MVELCRHTQETIQTLPKISFASRRAGNTNYAGVSVFQETANGRVINKTEQLLNEFYVERDGISVGHSQKSDSNSEDYL